MFYKHSEMVDGHLNKCKLCTKKDCDRRYNDPGARARIRKYEYERARDPERKAKTMVYQRNSRANNPGKYRARVKVGNAKRDGKIKQENCKVCGDPQTQAHHTDYRRPLFVAWLCFKHHRELHGQVII